MSKLFLILVALIPIGTKKFLGAFDVLPEGDYFRIFLNLSDILLLALLAGFIFLKRELLLTALRTVWREYKFLVLFLFFAFISVFFAFHKLLALYSLLRLLLLVFLFVITAVLLRQERVKVKHIFAVVLGVSIFESVLGIFQFLFHGSVGFKFGGVILSKIFGEPIITPFTVGAGKIFIGGGEFLRAFGTMPHANILAAFLVFGLISVYYFWLKLPAVSGEFARPDFIRKSGLGLKLPTVSGEFARPDFIRKSGLGLKLPTWQGSISFSGFLEFFKASVWKRILMGVGIFVLLLGLVLTFSRSGWIVFFAVTTILLVWGLLKKDYRKNSLTLLVVIVISNWLLLSILGWAILPRANFRAEEPSVSYRVLYNKVGLETILEKPLGVGLGNQAPYGADAGLYQKYGVEEKKPWQFQPVHNLFILVGVETGVLGLLAFLAFLAFIFRRFLKNIKTVGPDLVLPALMVFSLLLFGLVDHFMWTLWSGQLMLWLSLGILAGMISLHSSIPR